MRCKHQRVGGGRAGAGGYLDGFQLVLIDDASGAGADRLELVLN